MLKRVFHRTRADGVNLYRTYSDEGKNIVQNETGLFFDEAVDVENAPYTYTESEEAPELTAEEALAIIMGGGGHET